MPRYENHSASLAVGSADPSSALTKSWFHGGSLEGSVYRLGKYEIVAQLGQGGMGKVYKARHTNLKRFFALKILRTDVEASDESIARFYREMEAIGRISHENVVLATDAGPIDGIDCLIMEYLEGTDLASLMRKVGRLPVPIACELVSQAAEGLRAIGERGLIHRDIKPSNLFLCLGGRLKILDLGLARLNADDELTRRGEVYGTADYIAPEVAAGTLDYGPSADIYSLGCAFYKMLSGTAPFESEEHGSFASKLKAHASTPPPPLSLEGEELPGEIQDCLNRMLAKEPALRPSANEVAATIGSASTVDSRAALGNLAERHQLVVRSLTHDSSTPLGKSPAETKVSDAQPSRFSIQGGGAWLVAGSMLVACFAALIGWNLINGNGEGPSSEAGSADAPVPRIGEPRQPRNLDSGYAPAEAASGRETTATEVEVLKWTGSNDLSFWEIDDRRQALTVQTDRHAMLALGTLDEGEHTLSMEVRRIDWNSGNWGVFFAYHTEQRGRLVRFERIGCFRHSAGGFSLSRSIVDIDTEATEQGEVMPAKVRVELDRQRNFIDLRIVGHQLVELRLNGEPVAELTQGKSLAHVPSNAKFGIYCSSGSANFYSPTVDGALLELHGQPTQRLSD